MKKLTFIITILGSVALITWECYNFFVTNKGIQYFAEDSRRLGIIVIIGLLGGLCALIYDSMSAKMKRRTKLYILGVLASTLSAFSVYMIYPMISSPSMIKGFGAMLILPSLVFIGLALFCCHKFRVILRKNNTEHLERT